MAEQTKPIQFTQYVLPDGRAVPVTIDRPVPIADKAQRIIEAGNRFECEILSTGVCSFTITNDDDGDLDIELAPNGPDVPVAIDRLIERFAA